jgi:hypothetical protein
MSANCSHRSQLLARRAAVRTDVASTRFLDEIETELAAAARRSFSRDRTRTAALEELHRLARAVTHELGRPITVFDFIRSAATRDEREHRLALVRRLRSGTPETER